MEYLRNFHNQNLDCIWIYLKKKKKLLLRVITESITSALHIQISCLSEIKPSNHHKIIIKRQQNCSGKVETKLVKRFYN